MPNIDAGWRKHGAGRAWRYIVSGRRDVPLRVSYRTLRRPTVRRCGGSRVTYQRVRRVRTVAMVPVSFCTAAIVRCESAIFASQWRPAVVVRCNRAGSTTMSHHHAPAIFAPPCNASTSFASWRPGLDQQSLYHASLCSPTRPLAPTQSHLSSTHSKLA